MDRQLATHAAICCRQPRPYSPDVIGGDRAVRCCASEVACHRACSTGDPVLCRAALFGLLCSGRVTAPELRAQPLSLLTSFVRAEAGS
ncbi:hypothetical protein CA602_07045 [Paraburkholderia hospita]|nr:hypothetical protein CA602_07045 [Paraburkholderia hospita]